MTGQHGRNWQRLDIPGLLKEILMQKFNANTLVKSIDAV